MGRVVRRGRRLVTAVGLGLAVAAWLGVAAPHVGAQGADALCRVTDPTGWTVLADVSSSAPGSQFLCNYSIQRAPGRSGTAITIEYFCTADEATARYDGVAGDGRDTETTPDGAPDHVLIIEEGPQADNPDNPQRDGVFSQFFEEPFGLMEKEWALFNPQVFATIVLLTNERGKVEEIDRFGVDDIEPVARTLANRHRDGAGCPIPEVPAAPGLTAGGGGIPGLPVTILVTIGVVTIGGYEVWRRRKGKAAPPLPPSVAPGVPPQCRGIATVLDTATTRLTVLEEAVTDLTETLEKAERIHRQNILKANVVVGMEIVSVFTNPALDLAVALRPSARAARDFGLGQKDTWKPKGPISKAVQQALDAAGEALETAVKRARQLAQEAAEFAGSINRRVQDTPAVKEAREYMDAAWEAFRRTEKQFERSEAARKILDDLERAIASNRDLDILTKQIEGLEDTILSKRASMNNAIDLLKLKRGSVSRDLDAAKQKLDDLLKGLGPVDDMAKTLDPAIQRQIDDTSAYVQDLTTKLRGIDTSAEMGEAVAKARRLQEEIEEHLFTLKGLRESLAVASSEMDKMDRRHTEQLQEVLKHGDVLQPEVDAARARWQRAMEAHGAASSRRWQELSDELKAAQDAAQKAELDAAVAQGHLDELRAGVDLGVQHPHSTDAFEDQAHRVGQGVKDAVSTVAGAVATPFTLMGQVVSEIVFGVGQSPQEIVEILVTGRQNISLLKARRKAVVRALRNQQREVKRLREQLRACVQANGGTTTQRAATPREPAAEPAA